MLLSVELGLFPLQLVLLPTERVPLHIFEPRYRELIGECLARDGEFGIVLADERGLREIGTAAGVAEVLERFPDGRLNIVAEGGKRFRVRRLTRGRSFQTAEVEEVADEEDRPQDEAVERGLALFKELREATESEVDQPDPARGHLSYQLASRVDFVRPVLDFAHMHATSDGAFTDVEAFASVLEAADEVLEPGVPFHIHFSDIAYANRNETKHLPYGEGTLRAEPLREALRRFDRPATVISESPDEASTQAIGAVLLDESSASRAS